MAELYEFGEFTLDVGERRLARGAKRLVLPPKAYDLLVALVRHAGRLVTKRDLLAAVWPDAFVEEGILSVHVCYLRKVLGDTSRAPRSIETVSRFGYRFIAPVNAAAVDPNNGASASGLRAPPRPGTQDTHFASTRLVISNVDGGFSPRPSV